MQIKKRNKNLLMGSIVCFCLLFILCSAGRDVQETKTKKIMEKEMVIPFTNWIREIQKQNKAVCDYDVNSYQGTMEVMYNAFGIVNEIHIAIEKEMSLLQWEKADRQINEMYRSVQGVKLFTAYTQGMLSMQIHIDMNAYDKQMDPLSIVENGSPLFYRQNKDIWKCSE